MTITPEPSVVEKMDDDGVRDDCFYRWPGDYCQIKNHYELRA